MWRRSIYMWGLHRPACGGQLTCEDCTPAGMWPLTYMWRQHRPACGRHLHVRATPAGMWRSTYMWGQHRPACGRQLTRENNTGRHVAVNLHVRTTPAGMWRSTYTWGQHKPACNSFILLLQFGCISVERNKFLQEIFVCCFEKHNKLPLYYGFNESYFMAFILSFYDGKLNVDTNHQQDIYATSISMFDKLHSWGKGCI